jgi:hypothetical protein
MNVNYLRDATVIGPIFQGLLEEWLRDLENPPQALVRNADYPNPNTEGVVCYLEPTLEIIVAKDKYRIDETIHVGEGRATIKRSIAFIKDPEYRKLLNSVVFSPVYPHQGNPTYRQRALSVCAIKGGGLYCAIIDEGSLKWNGKPASFTKKREMLTSIYREPFLRVLRYVTTSSEDNTRKALSTLFVAQAKDAVTKLEKDIESNQQHIESLQDQVGNTIQKLEQQQNLLKSAKLGMRENCDLTRKLTRKMHKELMGLNSNNQIRNVAITEEGLTAHFVNVIIEREDGDESDNLGELRVEIMPAKSQVIGFFPCSETLTEGKGDHIHPHVSTDGSPCLGNISEDCTQLIGTRDWGTLLILLNDFIRSYNRAGAYYDWFDEGEGAWERCYEDDFSDCRDCSDPDCPYYGDRWQSCHDGRNYSECTDCFHGISCPYYESECDECHADHEPEDCLKCSIENCPHYIKDEEDCYDEHEARCEDCSRNEDCQAYRNNQFDEEEPEEEEAASDPRA